MVFVSQAELRRRFNDGGHWERALQGELACCLVKDHTPVSRDEPTGTRSMTVDCRDADGNVRFRVHLYLRTRGALERLGGSGLPDPKYLVMDGVLYVVAPPRTDTTEMAPQSR